MAKIFPIDFEEKNSIAQDDFILFSDSEDGDKIKKAQYSNLKGEPGNAATVCVGSTTTGAAGTCACVTNSGDCHNAILNFTIPKGDKGDTGQTGPAIVCAEFNGDDIDFTEEDGNVVVLSNAKTCLKGDTGAAATVSVGTTTTLDAGCCATVTNSGTCCAAVFNFGIPKGDKGDTGATGCTGPAGNGIACVTSTKAGKVTTVDITCTNGCSYCFNVCDGEDGQGAGDVLGPASSTNGNLVVFDGASGKLIKDGGALTTKVFGLSSTSDTTTAQNAYDRAKAGKESIILYSGAYYYFNYEAGNYAYFSKLDYRKYDNASYTSIGKESLRLTLSSGSVTTIETFNLALGDYYVLRTGRNYGTPYTPEYDGSPATKKYVDDSYATLMGLGKFLSLWDATTGQPISFPLSTPYEYTTGDYFLVETVSAATPPVNYKPNGSSYTGTASSTTESNELQVGDIYIYDGTNWLLQLNHSKSVSFSEIAGSPSDNTCLCAALSTIPTDNCQLANGCGYTTCTGTLSPINTGTNGQVLTQTSSGAAWCDAAGGDVSVSTQCCNILTSGMSIWAGCQCDYNNLGTYDNNTVYLTIE